MSVKNWLFAYAAALLAVMLLDGIWLGFIARGFYMRELGPLMADPVQVLPALLFYLGYPAGVVALTAHTQARGLKASASCGALVGLMAYGTYDLTNWSTLKGYSAQLALADMAWGICISAIAASAAWLATRRR
jgi:uncharacterized membrane protein